MYTKLRALKNIETKAILKNKKRLGTSLPEKYFSVIF